MSFIWRRGSTVKFKFEPDTNDVTGLEPIFSQMKLADVNGLAPGDDADIKLSFFIEFEPGVPGVPEVTGTYSSPAILEILPCWWIIGSVEQSLLLDGGEYVFDVVGEFDGEVIRSPVYPIRVPERVTEYPVAP